MRGGRPVYHIRGVHRVCRVYCVKDKGIMERGGGWMVLWVVLCVDGNRLHITIDAIITL